MRFYFKVLMLVGLIVISRLAKQNTINEGTTTGIIYLPAYSQNNDNESDPVPAGMDKNNERISYYFNN
jgi:hypothetical protein